MLTFIRRDWGRMTDAIVRFRDPRNPLTESERRRRLWLVAGQVLLCGTTLLLNQATVRTHTLPWASSLVIAGTLLSAGGLVAAPPETSTHPQLLYPRNPWSVALSAALLVTAAHAGLRLPAPAPQITQWALLPGTLALSLLQLRGRIHQLDPRHYQPLAAGLQ